MVYEAQIAVFTFLLVTSIAGYKWGLSERVLNDYLEESIK